jgi:hypothetical protein
MECPNCGSTIPSGQTECPRCKSVPENDLHLPAERGKIASTEMPKAPPNQATWNLNPPAGRGEPGAEERQVRDFEVARQTYLAFRKRGLTALRSSELPTGVLLTRGESCFMNVRAGHWTEQADGTRQAGDYGQLLLTDRRLIFKSSRGPVHEATLGQIQAISCETDSLSIRKRDDPTGHLYRLEQPADAIIKLMCVFKMAQMTPPMDADELKELLQHVVSEA